MSWKKTTQLIAMKQSIQGYFKMLSLCSFWNTTHLSEKIIIIIKDFKNQQNLSLGGGLIFTKEAGKTNAVLHSAVLFAALLTFIV